MVAKGIPYDYGYLNNRTKTLKLYNGNLLEENEEDNTIQISQYNQLEEELTDGDEIINLIHEYLHRVSFRNFKDENNIGNLYYGFDEFRTEFITSIICMKIDLHYETYYKNQSAGYIDKNDYEFMKNLGESIGLDVLLEIYFTGNRNLLEQTLDIDLLLNMNEYIDYYFEIYDSLNLPRKVVNEILDRPVFEPQRKTLNGFINKINIHIDNMFDKKENLGGVKKVNFIILSLK